MIEDSQLWLDNEIDRKLDVNAKLFLLVKNRQQTHVWTLIGSGGNGLDIQEWDANGVKEEKSKGELFQERGMPDFNKMGDIVTNFQTICEIMVQFL